MGAAYHHFLDLGSMASVRLRFENDLRTAHDWPCRRFPSDQNDPVAGCRFACGGKPVVARFVYCERREESKRSAGVHAVGQESDQMLVVLRSQRSLQRFELRSSGGQTLGRDSVIRWAYIATAAAATIKITSSRKNGVW
jgi:hypothetical protein